VRRWKPVWLKIKLSLSSSMDDIFRARVKADKEAYLNEIAVEVKKCHRNGHLRGAYEAIECLSSSRPSSRMVAINKADGQPVHGEKETLDR